MRSGACPGEIQKASLVSQSGTFNILAKNNNIDKGGKGKPSEASLLGLHFSANTRPGPAQAGPNWDRARPSLDKGGRGKPSDVSLLRLHFSANTRPGPARTGPNWGRARLSLDQPGPARTELEPGRARPLG